MMPLLRISVFGKLQLTRGRQKVDTFPTKRAEELLGYLVVRRFTLISREQVIDELWPDNELSNGRASLSTALWRLRAAFTSVGCDPNDYLQATRDTVGFMPAEPFELDVIEFERHLAAADGELDALTRECLWREAIAAYHDPFCLGIYAEWCLIERERLERRYLRALGNLMASLTGRAAYREAVDAGQEILRRDPLREEAHRALMFCYWKLGDRARGVRQFLTCARLLQQELQVLPMPETIALYQRLVEERFDEARAFEPQRPPAPEALRTAYAQFAAAADNLNLLLDEIDASLPSSVAY